MKSNEIRKIANKIANKIAIEKYPELRKIVEKISDETIKNISKEVKNVKSEMLYKAQWVLEELTKDLKNRI